MTHREELLGQVHIDDNENDILGTHYPKRRKLGTANLGTPTYEWHGYTLDEMQDNSVDFSAILSDFGAEDIPQISTESRWEGMEYGDNLLLLGHDSGSYPDLTTPHSRISGISDLSEADQDTKVCFGMVRDVRNQPLIKVNIIRSVRSQSGSTKP